ncbi:MAG: hypothetical protein K1X31_10275 [Gemmatimonadaceae bacterium]|jgi:hypothetical protein|nr:hypothetical protein [Gemmatimonadaceae bacterium]
MQLALSSAASPNATLSTLVQGALRHGLAALELRAGDAHGFSTSPESAAETISALVRELTAAGIGVVGYCDTGNTNAASLASLAGTLRSAVFVDADAALPERIGQAERLRAAGAEVALVVRGDTVLDDARLAAREGLALVWECDAQRAPIGEVASVLLAEYGASVHHVRLLGGGPESVMNEGRGIGELMGRLALYGFAGSVILTPSSPRFHVAWSAWLERRAGTGCGSKAPSAAPINVALQRWIEVIV